MNVFFFALKRAYYGTMAGTRGPLRELGITPARVDLLKAVERHPKEWFSRVCLQRMLRDALGVAASTLTEMLQALEKLGLVERKYAHDRRFRVVELTARGKEMLARVEAWRIKDHDGEKYVASPFAEPEGRDGSFYSLLWNLEFFEELEPMMRFMARIFGSAGPYPPWHPDN